MAKNQVATDRPKIKDNFFKKSRSISRYPKFQEKNERKDVQHIPNADSNILFMRSNSTETPKNPQNSKVNNLQQSPETKVDKKPFDKKRYRLQKYSKKYKLEQWQDRRKKTVLHSYHKTLKEERLNPNSKMYHRNEIDNDNINTCSVPDENEKGENALHANETVELDNVASKTSKNKKSKFVKLQQEFLLIKEEKEKKKELLLKKKLEKEEAVRAYKKKKTEKYKKLNKKTKKGQPIMKDRIEMLLEKIQNNINS